MKIKKWLIISYILVILSPVVTGYILYSWISGYNREIQLEDYLASMESFDKYKDVLDNPNLYTSSNDDYNLIDEDDEGYINIQLYDQYGFNLFSSGTTDIPYPNSKEEIFKDLYEVKRGYKSDSLKRPVFQRGELVGIYKVTISRTDWIKGVNRRSIVAIILFFTHFILVLFAVNRVLNKKINNPLKQLINSMNRFAKGENVDINYNSSDEIGELISHFNAMKYKIEEKSQNLEQEKKSKEYMISSISHDLKTPLTSIRAYTEIIKNNKSDGEDGEYEDIILSKCDYMKSMIEDLYLYTLLTSEYEMDFVNVEGEEFFQMLLSGYEEICKKNGLEYSEDIKVKGEYKVDVKSMVRVMDNLVSNAIRYSYIGEKIYVGAISREYPLPEWINVEFKNEINKVRKKGTIIVVKNTGEDISEGEIENILEPFYKADNSRKYFKNTGTGLGLSIIKKIIDKHHGNIKVFSKDKTTIVVCKIKREEDKDEKNE